MAFRTQYITGRREIRKMKALLKPYAPDVVYEGDGAWFCWTEPEPPEEAKLAALHVPADGKVNGCDCGAVKSGSCPNQCS